MKGRNAMGKKEGDLLTPPIGGTNGGAEKERKTLSLFT